MVRRRARDATAGDRALRLLVLAASGAFYAIFVARTRFERDGATYFTLFDDAMVSMRYARNLADGGGLVWNVGEERVEGYTNLLWTLWMALLHLVGVPEPKVALAVAATGVALLFATVLGTRAVVDAVGATRPTTAVVAMALVAGFYPLVYWTLRGLEVGLVAALLVLAIALCLRLRASPGGATLAALAALLVAAVLTRTDAAVPCVLVAAYAFAVSPPSARRRTAVVLGGAILGTAIAHTLFRLAYYGEPLPNTYYLKLGGIDLGTRLERGAAALAEVGLLHLSAPAALAVGLLLSPARRRYSALALLCGVFAALAAYSVYVGGDAWEWMQYSNRYLTPGAIPLLVLAALFLDAELTEPSRRARLAAVLLLLGSAAALASADLDFLDDGGGPTGRRVVAYQLLLAGTILLLHRTRGRRRLEPAAAIVAGALLFLAVNGRSFQTWWRDNAFYVADDRNQTEFGLRLRESTPGTATIAVTWAGAVPYFSRRPSVDLLGKSDPVVASGRPRGPFVPGHNKWNYEYSIGRLRPDVVAQLFVDTEADARRLRAWGYEPVGGTTWVRRDSRGIDRDGLAAPQREGAPGPANASSSINRSDGEGLDGKPSRAGAGRRGPGRAVR